MKCSILPIEMWALKKSRQSVFYLPEFAGQGLYVSVFKTAVVQHKLGLGSCLERNCHGFLKEQ